MYYSSRFHSAPNRMASRQPATGGYRATGTQSANPPCTTQRCHTTGQDYGPNPYVLNIQDSTLQNPYYRRTLWTGNNLQLTEMCIGPGQDIGLEIHPSTDQFLRLEQGTGTAMMGKSSDNLDFQRSVAADHAVFVPAGTWHNVVNSGNEPMKLYSIYAPPHHVPGVIHCTQADSEQYDD